MKRVLLVDDDVELCELVTEYLKREGLAADSVHDGESGVVRAQSGDYAIVILDVMLPGIGGFEVLRRLRAGNNSPIPVVMLTARGDEVDRVLGLELGADDYLPKPFSSRELVARIRAILRRVEVSSDKTTTPNSERLVVGDVVLELASRAVFCGGKAVELTAMEFKLLELLMRAAGEVVTREEISIRVLERPLVSYDRSIDIHVSNLRRKLEGDAVLRSEERIKTVRGFGYVLVRSRAKTKDEE